MAVINILKDGTVVEDMSQVTVPNELMRSIYNIYIRRQEEKKEGKQK